jgi:predicted nucleotidyltransferase
MGLGEILRGDYLKKSSIEEITSFLQILISDLRTQSTECRIFLFGSYAKNTATVTSDIDLAVIIPDQLNMKQFVNDFYKNRSRIGIAVDFIFRKHSEFESNSNKSPIIDIIKEEGIEIFPNWSLNDKI